MRHASTVAILGMLAGCAAHTEPAPAPPEKTPPVSTPGEPTTPGGSTGPTTPAGTGAMPGGSDPGAMPGDPMPTTSAPGPATAAIDANLDRLKALQIFEVGGLL